MQRYNIVDYRLNECNKTRRRRNNNKIRRYTNNNQEKYLEEANNTTQREIGWGEITTTGGTGSMFISVIYTESEYSNTVNTKTHTNGETVNFVDVIDSDSDSDEDSKCDVED